MTRDEHLQEDDFRRGARGRLTVEHARHLEACAECKAVVREKYFDEALRNLNYALNYEPSDAEPAPAAAEPRPWGAWLSVAASIIVCAVGIRIVIALNHMTEPHVVVPTAVAYVHGIPRWDDAVAEALRRGRVDPAPTHMPPTTTALATADVDVDGRRKTQLTPRFAAFLESQSALRHRPGDHLLLGILYARADLPDDARKELNEYLRLHPNDAGARKVLANIRGEDEGK